MMIIRKEVNLMNLSKERYIILELIPTALDPKKGDIAQLSALKINGIKLEDRFDYRLDKKKIKVPDILNMTNYDNDAFNYVRTTKTLIKKFKQFIGDLPLLIIDNDYTKNYLKDVNNNKESVFKYLDLEISYDVFDKLIDKYDLKESNHLVDLLYEALIKEI